MESGMILILSPLLSALLLSAPGSVNLTSGQGQMTDIKVLERDNCDLQCPSVEERERDRIEIHQNDNLAITSSICNGTPGWRRIAFINMTDTSYNCPSGLNLTSYSKKTCGRSHTNWFGCSSTTFSVGGLSYSRVCGRLRAYQFGATSAFLHADQGIDSYYVEDVSLIHVVAERRQHMWTFAAGLSEVTIRFPNEACPCDTASSNVVPSFVENDYFCESGLHSEWDYPIILYADDVLWDGEDCTSTSTCCQFNNPPWFTKSLPIATTDDIELRICDANLFDHEDIPNKLLELYMFSKYKQ